MVTPKVNLAVCARLRAEAGDEDAALPRLDSKPRMGHAA